MTAPTMPAAHEEYEALAVAWAIDALEPADQDRFEAHRIDCAACVEAVAVALDVAVELAYGVPDIEPPPALRRRLLAAAALHPPARPMPPLAAPRRAEPDSFRGHRDLPSQRPSVGPIATARPDTEEPAAPAQHHWAAGSTRAGRHRRADRRRLGSLLAAAALVALSAVTTWQVAGPEPDRPADPVAVADRVAALSARVGDRTVATVVVGPGRADVVTDALPPNTGRGTSYVVWGVPAGGAGAPRMVGSFEVTAEGLHSYPVRLVQPADDYPVLAVSEEPAGTRPTTPSGVIARGALNR